MLTRDKKYFSHIFMYFTRAAHLQFTVDNSYKIVPGIYLLYTYEVPSQTVTWKNPEDTEEIINIHLV
jgi:hypothetical protein